MRESGEEILPKVLSLERLVPVALGKKKCFRLKPVVVVFLFYFTLIAKRLLVVSLCAAAGL